MLLLALALSTVRLSDLDLSYISQGWGQAQRNRSVTETPLSIGGKRFDNGIGTHAISRFILRLDRKAVNLHAFCGIDDNAKVDRASARFHVLGDGKELWRSPVMRWKQAPVEVNLSIKGVRRLLLTVDDAGDGIDNDHADWADASIDYEGAAPITKPPLEEPVILTPPAPRTPRINGSSVFGVRPGSPFLYRIPATGDRPMRFSVVGLPKGLSLDPRTGIITGSLAKRGSYAVTLVASNRLKTARRPFRIECGDKIALTPYMGWNSWYVWEGRVSDRIMRQAADAMVSTGLADHGWNYVNIDDCWARRPQDGPTRDSEGRILPNAKFPDMRSLTDYIHSKGLKAGIYTSPGPTTCAGFEGAFNHEAIDARTFSDWGYDLLKYDWCSYRPAAATVPEFKKPYRQMGDLVRSQKRDIVFNLCQYGMGKVWQWGGAVGGNSWRTAGDLGVGFPLFTDGLDLYAKEKLHLYARPGQYNDPDYLLLGKISDWNGGLRNTPFTPNEQYLQMTFWCLVSAPLILSGDVTHLDPFTLSLLTNDEVLAVNQDPLVKAARRVSKDGDLEVWLKPLVDGLAVGMINRGEDPTAVVARWKDLGIKGRWKVRVLWSQADAGVRDREFRALVPRHGAVLIKLTR